ncbi:MAG: HK97 family phage prohead protease [Rhodobacteraceae bacterium]|nr:HK97 family phage prohead protease [Paracoccaceae bacterium]
MLWGGVTESGGLELRRAPDGGIRLAGSFPYGKYAVLSDGGRSGRPQKEVIASRAFEYRVNDPKEDIHFLVGHDYDHVLASKGTGTLTMRDTAAALIFEASISRAITETSYGRDALAMIAAGLAVGISPGFRIPPARAVPDAEDVSEEPDDGEIDEQGQPRRGALIRTVKAALLYELSVVVRPAYPEAQVEARSWSPETCERAQVHPLKRWRA